MVSSLFFYFFFLAMGAIITTSAYLVLQQEKRERREGSNVMQSIPLQFRHSSDDIELQASPVQPPNHGFATQHRAASIACAKFAEDLLVTGGMRGSSSLSLNERCGFPIDSTHEIAQSFSHQTVGAAACSPVYVEDRPHCAVAQAVHHLPRRVTSRIDITSQAEWHAEEEYLQALSLLPPFPQPVSSSTLDHFAQPASPVLP
ncbi:hypothetical protein PENSPDRAFT_690579 [Peniophora sp. CONT]|nr:hypothetical protein PENSPDRAFT_690579 [Peniophora sp. CONT]